MSGRLDDFGPETEEPQRSRGPSKTEMQAALAEAVKNAGGKPVGPNSGDRRFTEKADLDPSAVRSLPLKHPALAENRTLFPSTVVDVNEDFDDRILVSGKNGDVSLDIPRHRM